MKPSGHWGCARSFRGQAESGAMASTGRRVRQCHCPLAFSALRPGRSRVPSLSALWCQSVAVAAGDPPRGGVRVMIRGPNLSWRRDCPPPSESSIWAALAGDLRRGYIVARRPESPAHGAAGSGCRCGHSPALPSPRQRAGFAGPFPLSGTIHLQVGGNSEGGLQCASGGRRGSLADRERLV